MELPYLKVDPESAIKTLDELTVEGYKFRQELLEKQANFVKNEQWSEHSQVIEAVEHSQQRINSWYKKVQSSLTEVYVSERESFKFGDFTVYNYTNRDDTYSSVIEQLDQKIEILNKQIDFIFDRFNVHVTVQAERDAFVQIGSQNSQTQEND